MRLPGGVADKVVAAASCACCALGFGGAVALVLAWALNVSLPM